ncbi:MMPL family transporter [Granulicoccus sp. GXG6511]|uniref:MMPL family transporter n=1 Tax=Granulicoccus sp. GXG6511 TaxID=3381351 RepID=UPI003D7DB0E6
MSTYLYDLGRWCFRMRRRVLLGWLAALVVLGALAGIFSSSFDDAFEIPGAQSQQALNQLNQTFPEVSGTRASILVLAPDGKQVSSPDVKEALERNLTVFNDLPYVSSATSPFDPMVQGLVNPDETAAIINVLLDLEQPEITDAVRGEITDAAATMQRNMPSGTRVQAGGDVFSVEIPGMSIIELIGVGVAMIVLLFTLGSVVAAGMPLITAILGVAASMALMLIATALMPISSTTPMLAVMLGLAVGIDYALFILSRHRDQLGQGMAVEESTARSVATAGSAVVFAGLTVVIALVGLSLAGIPFLGVMGVFAAVGVALAVIIALTLLPALIGFAGERMRPKPRRGNKAAQAVAPEGAEVASSGERPLRGPSAWWVGVVTKVPILTVIIVVATLGALSIPAKDLQLSLPNSGQHSATAPDRITYDLIEDKFGPGFNAPLIVTAEIIGSTDPLGLVDELKRDIEAMPGVNSVPLATPNRNADTGFIQIIPAYGPTDDGTKELVQTLRDKAPDWEERLGVRTAVTGMTAVQIDVSDRLAGALLPFGIFVVGLSLVLLTMVFRSIWVPLKATVGYLLSVGTAFGLTTMIFNYGWGKEFINLEKPTPVISFFPILLMGILFGLAMDYEVFLVSRMREEYVHGRSAAEAIRHGFVGSAKVVVAAALIMVAVFAFFVPEGEGPIKPIAFGLAVGVAVDAFVVRMTLVPAVLALLGDRAWHLPKWLDRRLPSFDVEGEALTHVLALADWPGTDDVLHTDAFAVTSQRGTLAAPVDLHLKAGELLVIEGASARRTPLLLALAGRLTHVTGRAKVAGGVLPEEAAKVRRQVAFIDVLHPDGTRAHEVISGDLDAALRNPRVAVLVVDGADALRTHAEREALATLIANAPDVAILLGVENTELVAPLAPRGYFSIELTPPEAGQDVSPGDAPEVVESADPDSDVSPRRAADDHDLVTQET